MPFKKYTSGNPSGKPLGAKNKTTIEIKEFIVHFISYNIDSIQTNFNELEPKDNRIAINIQINSIEKENVLCIYN